MPHITADLSGLPSLKNKFDGTVNPLVEVQGNLRFGWRALARRGSGEAKLPETCCVTATPWLGSLWLTESEKNK